jgi:glycosidase
MSNCFLSSKPAENHKMRYCKRVLNRWLLFLLLSISLYPLNARASNLDSLPRNDHPSWSKGATIYEVNLRQYSAAGNFAGFERSLPRLKAMGVKILWFMPINPIGLEGRKDSTADLGSYYAVKDYYGVNPEYGTMEDWKKLVKKAHEMGFYVILDWVPNHTSPDNRWINSHPDFYRKDSTGKPLIPNGWTDTRKLNYDNQALRDSMTAAMVFWVKTTGIDGFRCDVAGDVPDDFWQTAIGTLRKIKPLFMLAEADKPSLHRVGFDATYPWSVMDIAYGIYSGKTKPYQLDSVIRHNDSLFPRQALRMYFTTNHDENSWNGTEYERFGEASAAFAVWAFTMDKSIPLIYSGQEEPNKKRLKFFVRDSIRWSGYRLQPFYKVLTRLKSSTPALALDASFRMLGNNPNLYAYLRMKDGRKLLVLLNLSAAPVKAAIDDKEIGGQAVEVFSGKPVVLHPGQPIDLPAWGYRVYNY